MRDQRTSGLTGFLRLVTTGITAVAGLASLVVISTIAVWPMWYLATRHTKLYSLGMMLVGATILIFVVTARLRRFLRNAAGHRVKHTKSEISALAPTEQAEQ